MAFNALQLLGGDLVGVAYSGLLIQSVINLPLLVARQHTLRAEDRNLLGLVLQHFLQLGLLLPLFVLIRFELIRKERLAFQMRSWLRITNLLGPQ